MANFGSLWIGKPLSKLNRMALQSFIANNHTMTLFVYDLSLDVPDGVKKEDARNIFLQDKIFLFHNSYAGFSDIFRINMIKKTGLIWVDVDTLCLSEDWNFPTNFIFGKQHELDHRCMIPGVLSFEKNHKIIDTIVKDMTHKMKSYNNKEYTYFMDVYPKRVKAYKLEKYSQPADIFHPINWNEIEKIFLPEYFEEVKNRTAKSKAMSLYNNAIKIKNIDQNNLPNESYIEYICKKIFNQ